MCVRVRVGVRVCVAFKRQVRKYMCTHMSKKKTEYFSFSQAEPVANG